MSSHHARDIELLRVTVAQLAARVAALEQRVQRPSDADLLSAIVDATAGRAFSARELDRHARLVAPDLQLLLRDAGAPNPRRLGKLLQRLSKQIHGNYRLVRATRDAMGTVWEVRVHASESALS